MVDNFKYQHSHLLQFLYEAHKDGHIDQFEKIKIKEMIITKNPDFCNLYEEYDKTKDSSKFIENLKCLCSGNMPANEEEDLKKILSSPEDSRLVKRKKAKASTQKQVKAPEMFGDSVQQCDQGLSPKITFSKRRYDEEYEDDSD